MKLYKIKKFTKHRCQDTMVGGTMVRGVSGGERKRVCIGSEILFNPALLFLDEPTSGLDSTTSLKIIQMLHDLAKAGKTIITAIHQPSGRLFYKFDKLILLGKGNLLYSGKTSEVMGYFGSIGFSPLIAMNPAEFLVDVANGNINDTTLPSALESKMQIRGNPNPGSKHGKSSSVLIHEYLVEAYESTVEANEGKKLMAPIRKDKKSKLCSVKREWGASWWQQYSILFQRAFKEQRHEYLSWLKISQVLAIAVILGFLWWQSGCKTEKELEDQAGLLFFIAVFWGFVPLSTATFTFPQEKAMLIKERGADMYRLSAYFLARTTSDLLLNLVLPLLFLLIVYLMAGLKHDAATFSLTLLTIFLSVVAAQGLGLAIGASVMDLKKATTLVSIIVMTFTLAGGYFVKEVPTFMSWTLYLSCNYHTYHLLLKIQYEHHTQPIDGLNFDNGLNELVALIAMVLGYRLLAYIFLRNMELHL